MLKKFNINYFNPLLIAIEQGWIAGNFNELGGDKLDQNVVCRAQDKLI